MIPKEAIEASLTKLKNNYRPISEAGKSVDERKLVTEIITAAFAAMSEPVDWPNRCNESAIEALRYLADNERPIGGEDPFNRAHLLQIASELERMASRPLYAAPQPAAVKVKPLEWEEYNRGEWRAFTAFGTYWCGGEGWSFGSDEDWRAGNIDYAQADYEARILSTLTPATDLAAENERLRAALERVAPKERSKSWLPPQMWSEIRKELERT